MKTSERIKQDVQQLISSANAHIVEQELEFEGQKVKAYLFVPNSLASRSQEVAESIFGSDTEDEDSEEEAEEGTEKKTTKKSPVKKGKSSKK